MKEMRFNRELYSKISLLKAAYSFTDTAYVHLDADQEYYYVSLTPKAEETDLSKDDFINEMLAQSVRHEIYLQTKNIRELMYARALATSVVDLPEADHGVSDSTENFQEDEILKDWFSDYEDITSE